MVPYRPAGANRVKLHLETGNKTHNRIRAYSPGQFVINQATYHCSLIVTPERIITDWPPTRFEELSAADLTTLIALDPELIVLGTGPRLRFPTPAHTQPMVEANIGFEVMDTAAACRTYNILMGEGRKVAAGLILLPK